MTPGQGPSGGSCTASPPVGNFSTVFTISCSGITDIATSLPISFAFFTVQDAGTVQLSEFSSSVSYTTKLQVPTVDVCGAPTITQQLQVVANNNINLRSIYPVSVVLVCTTPAMQAAVLAQALAQLASVSVVADPGTFFSGAIAAASSSSPNSASGSSGLVGSLLGSVLEYRSSTANSNPSATLVTNQATLLNSLSGQASAFSPNQTNATLQILSGSMSDLAAMLANSRLGQPPSGVGSSGASPVLGTFATVIGLSIGTLSSVIPASSSATDSVASNASSQLAGTLESVSTAQLLTLVPDGPVSNFASGNLSTSAMAMQAESALSNPANTSIASPNSNASISFTGGSLAGNLPPGAGTVSVTFTYSSSNYFGWQTNVPNTTQNSISGALTQTAMSGVVGLSLFADGNKVENVSTSEDSPFVVSIPVPDMTLTNPCHTIVATCVWWDTELLEWSSEGCTLTESQDGVAACSCTHLTMFSLQLNQFAPSIRTLSLQDFANVSWDNIVKNPFTLICLSALWVLYILLLFAARKRDRDLMQLEKHKSVMLASELDLMKRLNDQANAEKAKSKAASALRRRPQPTWMSASGKKIPGVAAPAGDQEAVQAPAPEAEPEQPRPEEYSQQNKQSVKQRIKQSNVFQKLRDKHLWFSILSRPSRARIDSQMRAMCALVLILTAMLGSAVFYGNGSSSSDMTVGVISSAMAFCASIPLLFLFRGGSFVDVPLSDLELRRKAEGKPLLFGPMPVWGPRFGYMVGYSLAVSFSYLILVYGMKFDLQDNPKSSSSSSTSSSQPGTSAASTSCGAVNANAEAEAEGESEAESLEQDSSLNFAKYVGHVSVATRWMISVTMAIVQDMIINKPGSIMLMSVWSSYLAKYFLVPKAPKPVRVKKQKEGGESGEDEKEEDDDDEERSLLIEDPTAALALVGSMLFAKAQESLFASSLFHKSSRFRDCWTYVRIAVVIYYLAMSPLRWGFYPDQWDNQLFLDYALDGFMLLDLWFRAFKFQIWDTSAVGPPKLQVSSDEISGAFFKLPETPFVALATAPFDVVLWCL